jgi:hypothetical protein
MRKQPFLRQDGTCFERLNAQSFRRVLFRIAIDKSSRGRPDRLSLKHGPVRTPGFGGGEEKLNAWGKGLTSQVCSY